MLVVFPPIFVVDIKIIFDYNFIAPLMHPDYFFCKSYWKDYHVNKCFGTSAIWISMVKIGFWLKTTFYLDGSNSDDKCYSVLYLWKANKMFNLKGNSTQHTVAF